MRINNATNPTPPLSTETPAAAASRSDSSASGVPVPAESSRLVPSSDLLDLHAALNQLPTVREDRVAAAVARLASGQLRTPDALAQTADALLQQ